MSILTREEILAEIDRGRIKIEPFEPTYLGAASLDLHLGNAFRIFRNTRNPIRVDDDACFKGVTEGIRIPDGGQILLMPGETLLGITREKITLADDICGWLEGRSRFARLGLLVHISASFMQPGISNHQVLEITNFGPNPLEIVPGTRICQFIFQRTVGRGRYQGTFSDQTPEEFVK